MEGLKTHCDDVFSKIQNSMSLEVGGNRHGSTS